MKSLSQAMLDGSQDRILAPGRYVTVDEDSGEYTICAMGAVMCDLGRVTPQELFTMQEQQRVYKIRLEETYPELEAAVLQPWCSCGVQHNLHGYIVHMFDNHGYSADMIAGFLEGMGL